MICPKCGCECTRDTVDVGVGEVPVGPWGCENCGWYEEPLEVDDDLFGDGGYGHGV